MERRIGVVRKWVEDRGFGFIRVLEQRDDGKPARVDNSLPDVFLRVKELKLAGIDSNKIETGDTLEFDITQYAKGLVASKVALVR
jgi:cold shock CspA family protein